jgi:hypothetical protein
MYMAGLLVDRYRSEIKEELRIRELLNAGTSPREGHFVIDSEGITPVSRE